MNILEIPIAELKVNDNLVNLGIVLEIEKTQSCYMIVIDRMSQKQVFKFFLDHHMFIHQDA